MSPPPIRILRPAAEWLLGAFCIVLCWQAVDWAVRPGLFFAGDEIGNLAGIVHKPYSEIISLLPQQAYNDRPLGLAVERLLLDGFVLHYQPQLIAFLAIHFANCILAFLLFRRLGLVVPLSVAAVAAFGSLSTTAMTATYIGAVFDVVCLFFLLCSALTLLVCWRGSAIVSAVLFLAALRSKEFAIVAPVLFTILLAAGRGKRGLRESLSGIARRLWPHYVIAAVFLVRYAVLIPRMRAVVPPSDPYFMVVNAGTAVRSIAYYTGLIFAVETPAPMTVAAGIVAVLIAAIALGVYRRRPALAFGAAGYALTLLPVSFLPHMRSPFYVYAPAVFLALAVGAAVQEAVLRLFRESRSRWGAAAIVCLVSIAYGFHFGRSDYFVNKVNFMLNVRTICMRTADAVARHPSMFPGGSHVYINHGQARPWLLAVGNCDYLKVVTGKPAACFLNRPESELLAMYARDSAPKYFLDYAEDGTFTVRQFCP